MTKQKDNCHNCKFSESKLIVGEMIFLCDQTGVTKTGNPLSDQWIEDHTVDDPDGWCKEHKEKSENTAIGYNSPSGNTVFGLHTIGNTIYV